MKKYSRTRLRIPGKAAPGRKGILLGVDDSLALKVRVKDPGYPVKRVLRIVGEVDLYWRKRCEPNMPESVFRSIVDAIDSKETFRGEQLSLHLSGNGETWARNAYIKVPSGHVSQDRPLVFSVAMKTTGVRVAKSGELGVELGVYLQKPGRHYDDVYDPPDEIIRIDAPRGTHAWKVHSRKIVLPGNTAMVLVRLGGVSFKGDVWFGSPVLCAEGRDTAIPPFVIERSHWLEENWLGENLSMKEWPRFKVAVDGRKVHEGAHFNAIFRSPDLCVPLPAMKAGQHQIDVKLLRSCEQTPSFVVLSAEIMEESVRGAELVAYPEYVVENSSFPVLVEDNRKGKNRLGVVRVEAGAARGNPVYEVKYAGEVLTVKPRRVVRRDDDDIKLSTGDAIYVPQESEALRNYIKWYVENQIGNAVCFRPVYRWCGTRECNRQMWRELLPLLEKLDIKYSLMVDGRELPGKNVNPPDALLAGPNYMGRQSHEQDGAFCYWLTRREDSLFIDIFHRSKAQGGNSPAVRSTARERGTACAFFDPLAAEDMKSGAELFLRNLKAGKDGATRHTGPSTLFGHFYRAGYDWLGAEQMYGPEEVILASLRGASAAYGVRNYGAHLAVQWSSSPQDTPEHAERYFLSLATCYLQGVEHINTEEGLWRMESDYAPHDRFSRACTIHREAHQRFYRFMQTHPRRGQLRSRVGIFQGRYCGWRCFGNERVWGSERDDFRAGPPEKSFDLLHIFYPRSVLGSIYRSGCADNRSEGWYTGTPYGPIDLMPIDTPIRVMQQYSVLAFLGWNTFKERDFKKLLRYVRNGGTLLLAGPHVSRNTKRWMPVSFPGKSPALDALLGKSFRRAARKQVRTVGKGKVIFFPGELYPAEAPLRKAYEKELQSLVADTVSAERERGWIEGSPDVNFAAYDWPDGVLRTIYLLNIDWWSGAKTHKVKLLLGDRDFSVAARAGVIETVTTTGNFAVMPDSPDADIMDISEAAGKIMVTCQSDAGTRLKVFRRDTKDAPTVIQVPAGGVREVTIE